MLSKTADAKAVDTIKKIQEIEKTKSSSVTSSTVAQSPPKKLLDDKKVDSPTKTTNSPSKVTKSESPGKTVQVSSTTSISPKKEEKRSSIVKPMENPKLEYVPLNLNKLNIEEKASTEMKKKLEAQLESTNKDSKQLENQYDQLQKDKETKLKEYREMIMKMKKDRRSVNTKTTTSEVVVSL